MDRETVVDVLRLGRLHFVLGGLFIYTFGALLAVAAGAEADVPRFAFGYAVLFCAHLSVSYSNDAYDAGTDHTTTPTVFSGGSKVLVRRPELVPLAKGIAVGLIVASLAMGALFIAAYGLDPFFMGLVVLGNLLGFYYSAPPLRLAQRGLGELSTAVTAGLLIPAMGYVVMSGTLDAAFLLFVPALLMFGLVFIINVQIPDMEADTVAGRRTLIVSRGRVFGFVTSGALMLSGTAYYVALAVLAPPSAPVDLWLIAAISAIPLVFTLTGALRRPEDFEGATRHVTGNVGSLFIYMLVAIAYLLVR